MWTMTLRRFVTSPISRRNHSAGLRTAQAEAHPCKVLDGGVVMCEHLQLRKQSDTGGLRAEKKEWEFGATKSNRTQVTMRSHLGQLGGPAHPATQIRMAASWTKQSADGDAGAPLCLIRGRPTDPGREVPLCPERNGEVGGVNRIVAGIEALRW